MEGRFDIMHVGDECGVVRLFIVPALNSYCPKPTFQGFSTTHGIESDVLPGTFALVASANK
jgi:hypothetical protein